jgi:tRNA(fMet)-specific endonuclease VapC
MINFMLDTDTCIYTIKRKPLHLKRLFNANIGRLCISSVTWGVDLWGKENK